MFGFLKRDKQDQDALSNLKTVTRWLQDLPAGDIYSAQEKVVESLIQFNHAGHDHSKERLQILMCLDEETRDMQASMCLQYLRNLRMSKSIESRLWQAIHAFYWEITRGYHGFLMDFVANSGGSNIQGFIPLITGRAARGFADIIKWRYFRYERIDEKLWLRLHNLYRIAEFDNFASTRLKLYRGDRQPRSVAEEYGQALYLSLFGSGNLAPRDVEMVDHWLHNWSAMIRIDSTYVPDRHLFYVDTGKGQGLRRCRTQGSDPGLRFLSGSELRDHSDELHRQLRAGAVPVTLGLTEDFRLPQGYRLLNRFTSELSPLPQRDRRGSARIPYAGEWKVVRDLGTICTQLEHAERQGPAEKQGEPSPEEVLDIKVYGFVTERTREKLREREREADRLSRQTLWPLLDMSGSGLGFVVDEKSNEWIRVGKMLALSPLEETSWQLGVISRIARLEAGNRVVGISLFTDRFQAASLKADGSASPQSYVVDEMDLPEGRPPLPAILLSRPDGTEALLMDSASYARDRQYLLGSPRQEGRWIRLAGVEDSGENWLLAAFSVIAG